MYSTISFWEQRWLDKADIVVVGSGLVGMQVAIQLKQKFSHRAVWVLDKQQFGTSASLRNAGFACFGSAGEILDDAQNMGMDNAIHLYEQRFQGLNNLLKTYGTTSIGFDPTGGYEIFQTDQSDSFEAISLRLDEINSRLFDVHGGQSFQIRNSKSLNMNVFGQTIFAQNEGALQTHLLVERVKNHALSLGVSFFENMDVLKFEELDSGKWQIHLKDNNAIIEAKELIICTNGYTKELLPEIQVAPARGQVLVTKPIPNLPFRGIFHADKGYVYFRSLGSRILIGGARNLQFAEEETTESNSNPIIKAELIRWLTEIIAPNQSIEIEYEWAGIMGMDKNRQPIVEKYGEHCYLAVRMGGMGVALSSLVAEKLAILVD